MNKNLFRKEALQHQKSRLWGDLLHLKPLSSLLLTTLIISVTLSAILFLFHNDYTRKEVVRGHLVPDKAAIEVMSANDGRVFSLNVDLGQRVEKGDELFSVQVDEAAWNRRYYTDELLEKLSEREGFINQQIALEANLLQQKLEDNRELRISLAQQIEQLEALSVNEQSLVEIKQRAHERALSLHAQNFIPAADLEARYAEYLQQQGALQNLLLRKTELEEEDSKLERYLESYQNESRQRRLELEMELAVLQQEIISTRFSAKNTVIAPVTGDISAITHSTGDRVSPQQAVLLIIPDGAVLEAELFVPSSAIGFIAVGQAANIRFPAYPYQKFGAHAGWVESISSTVLLPEEVPRDLNISEPVFRVNVSLESQSVQAFGEAISLRSGMLLEATIVLEKRSLLEWLLEPLYSVINSDQNV